MHIEPSLIWHLPRYQMKDSNRNDGSRYTYRSSSGGGVGVRGGSGIGRSEAAILGDVIETQACCSQSVLKTSLVELATSRIVCASGDVINTLFLCLNGICLGKGGTLARKRSSGVTVRCWPPLT